MIGRESFDGGFDFCLSIFGQQIDLVERVTTRKKMNMGVVQAWCDRASLGIDSLSLWSGLLEDRLVITDCDDSLATNADGRLGGFVGA